MEINCTDPFFQGPEVVESKQTDIVVLWYHHICLTPKLGSFWRGEDCALFIFQSPMSNSALYLSGQRVSKWMNAICTIYGVLRAKSGLHIHDLVEAP